MTLTKSLESYTDNGAKRLLRIFSFNIFAVSIFITVNALIFTGGLRLIFIIRSNVGVPDIILGWVINEVILACIGILVSVPVMIIYAYYLYSKKVFIDYFIEIYISVFYFVIAVAQNIISFIIGAAFFDIFAKTYSSLIDPLDQYLLKTFFLSIWIIRVILVSVAVCSVIIIGLILINCDDCKPDDE